MVNPTSAEGKRLYRDDSREYGSWMTRKFPLAQEWKRIEGEMLRKGDASSIEDYIRSGFQGMTIPF
jgi:hypothetical protein